ncbi:MAG TPA: methyltransferase domain-containing protein [Actinophytocola sp.]|uniref:methyltransferase domain-containing protein n=1 Tax=Actinophytocola sp. TaxID=1872138 RepID=UPI002DDD43DF|nr:methyltransferase domain-containing protein [Actinophytocola sp.]HEV2779633.1 methyltransferase domain-containing protein [Actinophytocola sp.]
MDDIWSRWLTRRRHGGDPEVLRRTREWLAPVRDRVLDGAGIAAGQTVLDIGCGDGLLGFGALDRVGDDGMVIFSDVSSALVDTCREVADEAGVADRCRFVVDGLPDLAAVPDASVDVALTRSVLIYVDGAAKPAAFAAMLRVLRPGGRLSMFEPINRHGLGEPPHRLFGFDVRGHEAAAAKVRNAFQADGRSGTLLDFDERDLLDYAERAGFVGIKLDLIVEREVPVEPTFRNWDAYLASAPNPRAATIGEVLDRVLDRAERAALERHVRPQLETGTVRYRSAVAYLRATRPV